MARGPGDSNAHLPCFPKTIEFAKTSDVGLRPRAPDNYPVNPKICGISVMRPSIFRNQLKDCGRSMMMGV